MNTLIKDITIINEGLSFQGSLLIKDELIEGIIDSKLADYPLIRHQWESTADKVIDGKDSFLIPGVIDDQVHFREPGATQKGDIESESAAAVLGGTTSFMDMPNNNPPVVTCEALEQKYEIASRKSYANYSFYLGATNHNIEEIRKADPRKICGIKLFMGSSTGNMLVDSDNALDEIFGNGKHLVALHCEQESIVKENTEKAKQEFGTNPDGTSAIPFSAHPQIRSAKACIECSSKAIALAHKHKTRAHILHISTKEEIEMIEKARLQTPSITGEICAHYLFFDDSHYSKYGSKIKCNPAIKSSEDRMAIIEAVKNSKVAALATDHAPHLENEKKGDYLKAPSGIPTVQHSLQMMLQLNSQGIISKEQIVKMMCHAPADCFRVEKRGYIRQGYYADIVIFKKEKYTVTKENVAYKCGWSPFEGESFDYTITDTFINGTHTVADGKLTGNINAKRLEFDN